MTDSPLPYAQPAHRRRPIARFLILSLVSQPFLIFAGLIVAYSIMLLEGLVQVQIPLTIQLFCNIVLCCIFLAIGLVLARVGDPQRSLSASPPRHFSRWSLAAVTILAAGYLAIPAFWPVKMFLFARAPAHLTNGYRLIHLGTLAAFGLLPLLAFCSGTMDLATAFLRRVPLRGYSLSLLSMAAALTWLVILGDVQSPLEAAAVARLQQRDLTVECAFSLANAAHLLAFHDGRFPASLDALIDRITPQKVGRALLTAPYPATDSDWHHVARDFDYPGAGLSPPPLSDAPDLLLLVGKIPLTDAHAVYVTRTGEVEYAAAGYVTVNAALHAEIVSLDQWPARLARDHAARMRLSLPPATTEE